MDRYLQWGYVDNTKFLTYFEFFGTPPSGGPEGGEPPPPPPDTVLEENERILTRQVGEGPLSTPYIVNLFEFFGDKPTLTNPEGVGDANYRRIIEWGGVFDTISMEISIPTNTKRMSDLIGVSDSFTILSKFPEISQAFCQTYELGGLPANQLIKYPFANSPYQFCLYLLQYCGGWSQWSFSILKGDLVEGRRYLKTNIIGDTNYVRAIINSEYLVPVSKPLNVRPVQFTQKTIGNTPVYEYKFRKTDIVPRHYAGVFGKILVGWYHQINPFRWFYTQNYIAEFTDKTYVVSDSPVTLESTLASLAAKSSISPSGTELELFTLPQSSSEFVWIYVWDVAQTPADVNYPSMVILEPYFIKKTLSVVGHRYLIPETDTSVSPQTNSENLLYRTHLFGRAGLGVTFMKRPDMPTVGEEFPANNSRLFIAPKTQAGYPIYGSSKMRTIGQLEHLLQTIRRSGRHFYEFLKDSISYRDKWSRVISDDTLGVLSSWYLLPKPPSSQTSSVWHYSDWDTYFNFYPKNFPQIAMSSSGNSVWFSQTDYQYPWTLIVNPALVKYFSPTPVPVLAQVVWQSNFYTCIKITLPESVTGLVLLKFGVYDYDVFSSLDFIQPTDANISYIHSAPKNYFGIVSNGVGYLYYYGIESPENYISNIKALWYIDSLVYNSQFRSFPRKSDIDNTWKSLLSVLRHSEVSMSEKLGIIEIGAPFCREKVGAVDNISETFIKRHQRPYIAEVFPERAQIKLEKLVVYPLEWRLSETLLIQEPPRPSCLDIMRVSDSIACQFPIKNPYTNGAWYPVFTLDIPPRPFWRKLILGLEPAGDRPYKSISPPADYHSMTLRIHYYYNGHWEVLVYKSSPVETGEVFETFPVPPNISQLTMVVMFYQAPYPDPDGPVRAHDYTYRIKYLGDSIPVESDFYASFGSYSYTLEQAILDGLDIIMVYKHPIFKNNIGNRDKNYLFYRAAVWTGSLPLTAAQCKDILNRASIQAGVCVNVINSQVYLITRYKALSLFNAQIDFPIRDHYSQVLPTAPNITHIYQPQITQNYMGTSICKVGAPVYNRVGGAMLMGTHRYVPQVFLDMSKCIETIKSQQVSIKAHAHDGLEFYKRIVRNSGSIIYTSAIKASYVLENRESPPPGVSGKVHTRDVIVLTPSGTSNVYVPISLKTDTDATEITPIMTWTSAVNSYKAIVSQMQVSDRIYHNSIRLSERLGINQIESGVVSLKESLSVDTTEWQIVISEKDNNYPLIIDKFSAIRVSSPLCKEIVDIIETYGVDVSTFISEFLSTSQGIVSVVGRFIKEHIRHEENYRVVGKYTVVLREIFSNYVNLMYSRVFSKKLSESLSPEDKWVFLRLIASIISERLLSTPSFLVNSVVSRRFSEQIRALEKALSGFGHKIRDTVSLRSALREAFAVFLILQEIGEIWETPRLGARWSFKDFASISTNIANALTIEVSLQDNASTLINLFLSGDKYDCWVLSSEALLGSIYTNFNFNSFAVLNNQCFAAKEDGIYRIGGESDSGTPFVSGLRWDLDHLGTHLKKRMYRAYFGVAEDSTPLLRVYADNKVVTYRIVQGRADIAVGQEGTYWIFELEEINELNFIEIVPIILSR